MAKRKTNGTSKNETIRTTDMCVPRYFHSLLINHGTYQNIKRKTRFDCGGGKYHKHNNLLISIMPTPQYNLIVFHSNII